MFFSSVPAVAQPDTRIAVEPQRLIVGFSMGSSAPNASEPNLHKSVFIEPESLKEAFGFLPRESRPRGAMFWNMAIDGRFPTNGTNTTVDFARRLNNFLHTRV